MELKALNVSQCPSYGARPGEYEGTVTFNGQYGTIQVVLDHQLSTEVLKLCAASLTRATQDLANNLTAAVFEQAGLQQLDHKAND